MLNSWQRSIHTHIIINQTSFVFGHKAGEVGETRRRDRLRHAFLKIFRDACTYIPRRIAIFARTRCWPNGMAWCDERSGGESGLVRRV